jgi:hypothetical protein
MIKYQKEAILISFLNLKERNALDFSHYSYEVSSPLLGRSNEKKG